MVQKVSEAACLQDVSVSVTSKLAVKIYLGSGRKMDTNLVVLIFCHYLVPKFLAKDKRYVVHFGGIHHAKDDKSSIKTFLATTHTDKQKQPPAGLLKRAILIIYCNKDQLGLNSANT